MTAMPRSPASAAPQRGLGNVHQAVLAAGDLAPLDRDVLDDEGEGDGHHGEVGPGHAHGRQCQQRADGAGDDGRR